MPALPLDKAGAIVQNRAVNTKSKRVSRSLWKTPNNAPFLFFCFLKRGIWWQKSKKKKRITPSQKRFRRNTLILWCVILLVVTSLIPLGLFWARLLIWRLHDPFLQFLQSDQWSLYERRFFTYNNPHEIIFRLFVAQGELFSPYAGTKRKPPDRNRCKGRKQFFLFPR